MMAQQAAMTDQTLHVYTDGSALGNPGPGGWAYIITDHKGNVQHTHAGSENHTTNNRMEITAVAYALHSLEYLSICDDEVSPIVLYCDSEYVVKAITEWRKDWEAKGWKTSKRKPIRNLDLLKPVFDAVDRMPQVSFQWVRGHAGNPLNETVDTLARAEAEKVRLGLPANP